MELMDDSLTHFLERSEVCLPYHVQVNINNDIAQALAFLHANQILHRDLSSNNVLLIGDGARAKVTDFGMSKLTTLHSRMTPLTACPGTPVYMSPEAMLDPPVYTEKLDCFQAGVLMRDTPLYQQSHEARGRGGEIQERDQLIQQLQEENETMEREREGEGEGDGKGEGKGEGEREEKGEGVEEGERDGKGEGVSCSSK